MITMKSRLDEMLADLRVRNDEARGMCYFSSISGAPCYYDRPDLSHISIDDIAMTLSRTPRWGGRTRPDMPMYSVAEHSIRVADALRPLGSPFLVRVGFAHDWSEAYLGDIPSPLKRKLGALYGDIEESWSYELGQRFGLGECLASMPLEVKKADLWALEVERHDLMVHGEGWDWWGSPERPADAGPPIRPIGNEKLVALAFMDVYQELWGTK